MAALGIATTSALRDRKERASLGSHPAREQRFQGQGYSSDLGYATVFSFEVVEKQEDESQSDVECSSFVLSCDGAVPSKVRASEVIVDTGATESACGIETMERFLEATKFRYQVLLEDRPVFRFGNGRTMQATSRVDIITAARTLSVYVLDDETAQQTPLLLGGRALREIQAVVNYGDHTLMFQKRTGELRVRPVSTTPGSHLLVDLASTSKPLGSVKSYLAERFGIEVPEDLETLKNVLSVSGFSEEARRGRGPAIPGTEDDNAPPPLGQALQLSYVGPEKELFVMSVAEHEHHSDESESRCECHDFHASCQTAYQCCEWCLPVLPTSLTVNIAENVRDLRLKLSAHKRRQHERHHPSFPRGRSAMGRLAVQGQPHSGALSQQSVRQLADVHQVCSLPGVPTTRTSHRDVSSGGSLQGGSGNGDQRTSNGDGCHCGDGEAGERQVHGSDGPPATAGVQRDDPGAHGEAECQPEPDVDDHKDTTDPKDVTSGYYQNTGEGECSDQGRDPEGFCGEGAQGFAEGGHGSPRERGGEDPGSPIQRGEPPEPPRDCPVEKRFRGRS